MYNRRVNVKENRLIMTEKLDVKVLSNEQVEDLFNIAYAEQVGNLNNISEFDCKCVREVEGSKTKVEITVIGLAGSPTLDDYKEVRSEDFKKVVINRDGAKAVFNLLPKATVVLNSNDYVVTYQAV